MEEEIQCIAFPNTVEDDKQSVYNKKSGYSFETFNKNGEMASIGWIKVFKDGKKVAEIKESVCDIFF